MLDIKQLILVPGCACKVYEVRGYVRTARGPTNQAAYVNEYGAYIYFNTWNIYGTQDINIQFHDKYTNKW